MKEINFDELFAQERAESEGAPIPWHDISPLIDEGLAARHRRHRRRKVSLACGAALAVAAASALIAGVLNSRADDTAPPLTTFDSDALEQLRDACLQSLGSFGAERTFTTVSTSGETAAVIVVGGMTATLCMSDNPASTDPYVAPISAQPFDQTKQFADPIVVVRLPGTATFVAATNFQDLGSWSMGSPSVRSPQGDSPSEEPRDGSTITVDTSGTLGIAIREYAEEPPGGLVINVEAKADADQKQDGLQPVSVSRKVQEIANAQRLSQWHMPPEGPARGSTAGDSDGG